MKYYKVFILQNINGLFQLQEIDNELFERREEAELYVKRLADYVGTTVAILEIYTL